MENFVPIKKNKIQSHSNSKLGHHVHAISNNKVFSSQKIEIKSRKEEIKKLLKEILYNSLAQAIIKISFSPNLILKLFQFLKLSSQKNHNDRKIYFSIIIVQLINSKI